MQWDLAGYSCHPIDGEASQIEACATHLGNVAGDLRAQISQLRAINASEIWISVAGAHEAFQEVIDDLPEKLDLVAIRYEKVNGALGSYHPTLSSTKSDAEYNIEQAAQAQAEVERAESGIQLMEDFADQAQRDADAFNDANPDCAPREPDQWAGEDYHATLAAAQADLQRYVAAVQSAVGSFQQAAQACEQAIRDAIDDDLRNSSGWFDWVPSWDDFLDFLEVFVTVLGVIAAIVGVIALFVTSPIWGPIVAAVALTLAALVLVGTLILYFNDRASLWDVGWAILGVATGGLGFVGRIGPVFSTIGGMMGAFDIGVFLGNLFSGTAFTDRQVGTGDILERGYEVISRIDLPDLGDVYGPILVPGVPGLPPVAVPRPGGGLTGFNTLEGANMVFKPVNLPAPVEIPPTVVMPPNVDGSAIAIQPPPAIDVEIPQVTLVVDVAVPTGAGG